MYAKIHTKINEMLQLIAAIESDTTKSKGYLCDQLWIRLTALQTEILRYEQYQLPLEDKNP